MLPPFRLPTTRSLREQVAGKLHYRSTGKLISRNGGRAIFLKGECVLEKNTGNLELGLEAQNESQRSVRTTVQKDSRQKSYKLNARDAELFEFVAQMKFASLDTLFSRFFSRTLTGQPSKSDWYAKERLGFLVENGYLRTNEAITTSKRYYTTTIKGYQAAQQIMPFRELTKPIQGFDLRTFIHDRELILIREEMENQSEIVSWLSDRRLCVHGGSK